MRSSHNQQTTQRLADSLEAWDDLRKLSRSVGTHVLRHRVGKVKRKRCEDSASSSDLEKRRRNDNDESSLQVPDDVALEEMRIKELARTFLKMQRLQTIFQVELIKLLSEEKAEENRQPYEEAPEPCEEALEPFEEAPEKIA